MNRTRRFAEAIAFVGLWIAVGYLLRADVNLYLVLGVPLTVGFQLLVRRRRLEDLWVRGGRTFTRTSILSVAAVAVVATVVLLVVLPRNASAALWFAAAVVGVFGAVYALRHANMSTTRAALACLVTGGTIGVAFMVIGALGGELSGRSLPERLALGLAYLPLYFAVSFVLEEVTFRGAIDSHVHHSGESQGLLSAAAVSAMWGLWHLPALNEPLATAVVQLLVVHVPEGLFLSIFWRRSGNLAVPAFTHAFIDAVRNALIG